MRWLRARRLGWQLWLLVVVCFACTYLPILQLTERQSDAIRNACILVGCTKAALWRRRVEQRYGFRRRRDD